MTATFEPAACVEALWSDGVAASAGPLTGYRLFEGRSAGLVPAGAEDWVVQVHVPISAAGGHRRLERELERAGVDVQARYVSGWGVASVLVDEAGEFAWDPRTARSAGIRAERTYVQTRTRNVGLVLEAAGEADLRRTWALLDVLDDQLYGQKVLDRSAHLPDGARPPATARPLVELHLRDRRGRRLVHLTARDQAGPVAWVPARRGRFDLYDWITWSLPQPVHATALVTCETTSSLARSKAVASAAVEVEAGH